MLARYDQHMPTRSRARSAVETLAAVDTPDWDALAAAALERAGRAPTPTAYRAEWWPASVNLPDLRQAIRLARVYATPQGLYVYTRAPRQPDRQTGGVPFWWAPLDYDKTARPATGYAARSAGIHLVTDVGTAVVQPLSGCGCSNGILKAWRPSWAARNEPWEG